MKLIAIGQLPPKCRELAAKTLLVMKLAVFMLLAFTLYANASTFSQRVTVKSRNISLFKVFDIIESQTGYSFVYDEKPLSLMPTVSLNCKNVPIPEVLRICLEGTGLEYVTISKSIVIRPLSLLPEARREIAEVTEEPLSILVTGKVASQRNEPLGGVNISVKNSTTGTVSDEKGAFRISVPDENAILIFSIVGYAPQEKKIPASRVLNIVLEEQVLDLNEMVIVGYGQVKKKDLTGAVGSVQSDDIVRSNPVNASKALQGQVAGVVVQKTSNQPGQDYKIDIRGENTIDFSTEPLVVIDGLIGGRLRDINPSDIQSIDILKDASSTAIYGSRGANGVIMVTTKRGVSGRPKVTVDSYVGYKKPGHLPKMQTAQDFYQAFVLDKEMDGGVPAKLTDNEMAMVESGQSTDWVDMVTQGGLQTSNTVAVAGGSPNTTYRFSAGYLQEDGNLLYTDYKRYNLNAAMDSKINDYLRVGFTGYLNYSTQATGSRESLRSAYRARPTGTVYYDDLVNPADGYDASVDPFKGYAAWMGIKDNQVLNPLIEADPENSQFQVNTTNMIGNAYIEISPVKGLSFRSSISASVTGEKEGDYRGTYSKDRATVKLPKATYNTRDWWNYTIDNLLTYNYAGGRHKLTVTALQSAYKQRRETYKIAVENLSYASLWYNVGNGTLAENGLASSLEERTLSSYMGRINYSFRDKYLLTLTGRSDGASQLPQGNKWAFFPSAAVAWRLGDENFIRNLNAFSDLKLRVSYGEVGNSSVEPYSTQANIVQTMYDFDGAPANGFAPENMSNKDLRWERSRELNLGVDMGFFNNRITASVEVYERKTVDLILRQKMAWSNGFANIVANVGEISNKGVEVMLNTVNIATNDFSWSSNFNFASNKNRILKLNDGVTEDKANKLFVGHSLKSNYYYQFAGIWQLDEEEEAKIYKQVPGSVKVVDQNKDNQISSSDGMDDRVVLGSELPKWTLGVTNRFSYKAFDLSFFLYYRNGTQFNNGMLDGTMGEYNKDRYNHLKLNYWTTKNPTNDYFSLTGKSAYAEAIQYQSADFLRISDITVGYTLPKTKLDRLRIGNLRVYGQVSNPFIFTDWVGQDPEYNSNTYIDDVPNILFAAGVSVTF